MITKRSNGTYLCKEWKVYSADMSEYLDEELNWRTWRKDEKGVGHNDYMLFNTDDEAEARKTAERHDGIPIFVEFTFRTAEQN